MSYKIILIRSEHCYDDGDDAEINVQEIELSELLNVQDWYLQNAVHRLVIKAFESDDDTLRHMLKSKGWVNIKEIEDREKNLEASKEYWMYHDDRGLPLRPLDINHLSANQVRQLADPKHHVLQAISKDSVKKLMDQKQLKEYNQELARLKKLKQARAEANKKKAETKRLKAIAKAKKVLVEAGEILIGK